MVGMKFERDPVKNTALAVFELDALNRLYCIFVTVRVLYGFLKSLILPYKDCTEVELPVEKVIFALKIVSMLHVVALRGL